MPPPHTRVICIDELEPLAVKTYPGEEWQVGPGWATFEPDYGRRGKLWVHGAFEPATGQATLVGFYASKRVAKTVLQPGPTICVMADRGLTTLIRLQNVVTRSLQMRAHIVLVLVVVLGLMTGCIAPGVEFVRVAASGNPVTLTEDYAGFTKVDVGSAFRAEINQAGEYGVEITIDENLRDYLDVRVEGDTLRIGLRPGLSFSYGPDQLRAVIAMPALEALTLSGAARANVKGFESNDTFRAELSGASKLQGDLSAGDVQMEASGASNASLQGEGDALKLEVSGASSVDLSQFMVNDADVRLSGASQAQVNMKGTLDADLSGASKLTYEGDVKLGRVETNGASSINAR